MIVDEKNNIFNMNQDIEYITSISAYLIKFELNFFI